MSKSVYLNLLSINYFELPHKLEGKTLEVIVYLAGDYKCVCGNISEYWNTFRKVGFWETDQPFSKVTEISLLDYRQQFETNFQFLYVLVQNKKKDKYI